MLPLPITARFWTDDGTGTLGFSTSLSPIYYPGTWETGTVHLFLAVNGNDPCGMATDGMTLTTVPQPTAEAGPDITVCEGTSYMVVNASAGNYSSVLLV